jgi:hypothetical protein
MAVHLAREHALELERLDVLLEGRRVTLDVGDEAALALGLREVQQLERAGDAVPDPVELAGDGGELGALAT